MKNLFSRLGAGVVLLLLINGCIFLPAGGPREPSVPESHRQIFNEALRSFYGFNFEPAGDRFRSLIEIYPDTPLRGEAEWMIGRSAEEARDFSLALQLYQSFLEDHPDSLHRNEAFFRVEHLKSYVVLGPSSGESVRWVGVVLYAEPDAILGTLSRILPEFSIPGERVVIIPGSNRFGIFFESDQSHVVGRGLSELVSEAHGLGWKVWVRVPLRSIPGIGLGKEEMDFYYSPEAGRVVPSERLNLHHSSVTQKISLLFGDLARTGTDGIVIDDTPLYQPEEGFNRLALSVFKKEFGLVPKPKEWFAGVKAGKASGTIPPFLDNPGYWKWAGFRNREAMDRIEGIIQKVSEEFPSLVWIHHISPEAFSRPEFALARSGEDVLESLQNGFDLLLVSFSFRERLEDAFRFLEDAVKTVSVPERVNLLLPMDERSWILKNENDLPAVGYFFRDEPFPTQGVLTNPGR